MANIHEIDQLVGRMVVRRPQLPLPDCDWTRLSKADKEKHGRYRRYHRELPSYQDGYRRISEPEYELVEDGFLAVSFDTYKRGRWQFVKQVEEKPIPIRGLEEGDRVAIVSRLEPLQNIKVLSGRRDTLHHRFVFGLGENMDVFADLMEKSGVGFGPDKDGLNAYFLEMDLNKVQRNQSKGRAYPSASPDLVLQGSHLGSVEIGPIYDMANEEKNNQWANQSLALQMMFPRIQVTGFLAFYDRSNIDHGEPINQVFIYDKPVQDKDRLLQSTTHA